MNGLDFFRYRIQPAHVFFGFNLAGTEDPYFIDPWWRQIYDPDEAIKTWTNEFKFMAGELAAGTLALAAAVCACGLTFGVAITMPEATAAVAKYLGIGVVGIEPILEVENAGYRFGHEAGIESGILNGLYMLSPADWGDYFFQPMPNSVKSAMSPEALAAYMGSPDYRQNCRGHVEGLEPW